MPQLARFVTRHPWLVLGLWAVLALLSLWPAAHVPARLVANPAAMPFAESTRVTELLQGRFGERDTNVVLLVGRSARPISNAGVGAAYARFLAELRAVPGVARVIPFDTRSAYATVSPDGRATLTLAQIPLDDHATLVRIRTLTARYAGTPEADGPGGPSAGLQVRVTGAQAIADDFTAFAESDTKRSEFTALPLTALVLLFVFGALVATGLPLFVGVLSITVALGGLYGLTYLTEASTFAQSIITLLGLGAGIDYALLMVNRFREELARDGDSRAAAYRTILTAGRSVAFSGLTVSIAMAALIVPPIAFVRSMGLGGVLVVLLTILVSLTALPALLAVLGPRVNSPRIIRFTWSQNPHASAAWTALARRVTARPWLGVIGCTLFLLVLALPARDMRLGYAGAWALTNGVESRDALVDVQALGAGGLLSAFEVVLDLRGEKYGPAQRSQFRALTRELEGLPGVRAVVSPFVRAQDLGPGGTLSDVLALTRRSISADRTYLRLTVLPDRYLRADQIDPFERRLRATLNASGFGYALGGAPIGEREFSRAILDSTPLAVGIVFAATFVLLAIAFRSLLIPLKSILMNTLTVGAAYGVVTLVVQQGFMAAPLGIPADVGVLDTSLPLMLFAVLFGLSMDYEIFLLSRVQEEHLRGASNDEAVVLAVGRTGRIITSAAMIMFIVFCAFIVGRVVANKSIGLGLAVAVLLDATLVRMVLVPSFLKLAGRWNWWLPGWLERRMPQLRMEH